MSVNFNKYYNSLSIEVNWTKDTAISFHLIQQRVNSIQSPSILKLIDQLEIQCFNSIAVFSLLIQLGDCVPHTPSDNLNKPPWETKFGHYLNCQHSSRLICEQWFHYHCFLSYAHLKILFNCLSQSILTINLLWMLHFTTY